VEVVGLGSKRRKKSEFALRDFGKWYVLHSAFFSLPGRLTPLIRLAFKRSNFYVPAIAYFISI
jgi:hypothetical protein